MKFKCSISGIEYDSIRDVRRIDSKGVIHKIESLEEYNSNKDNPDWCKALIGSGFEFCLYQDLQAYLDSDDYEKVSHLCKVVLSGFGMGVGNSGLPSSDYFKGGYSN